MVPSKRPGSKRQRQLDKNAGPTPKRARQRSICVPSEVLSSASDKENKGPNATRASTGDPAVKPSRDVRCRAAEVVNLRNTLRTALQTGQGECVYIPGQPGTGKTHTVQSVLHSLECSTWGGIPATTFVNCENKQLGHLGRRIISGLVDSAEQVKFGLKAAGTGIIFGAAGDSAGNLHLPDGLRVRSNIDALDVLRQIATGSLEIGEGMCMVVLDELDRACEKADTFVKELFKLPKLPSSRLIIVGIANRMDLTERLLKGSELHSSQRPKLISFHSYSARQLLELLQERYPSKFDLKALELVAKRVSAASGDMRVAINVCDTAVRCASQGAPAFGIKVSGNSDKDASAVPQLISISQIAAALKSCGSGSSAAAATCIAAIQTLPAQQQLLLCTLAIARGRVAPTPSACNTSPGSMPTTPQTQPPLSARFAVLSGLQRTHGQTPTGKPPRTPVLQARSSVGFGLAGAPSASKSVNKAFPRADDEMLITPDTAPGTPTARGKSASKGADSPAAQKSDLPMATVFTKYKAAAKEAGLAALDMAQLQAMASALQECGLLEGRKVSGGKGAATRRLSLAVGTDDVKHALADNRMMQMLVQQLP